LPGVAGWLSVIAYDPTGAIDSTPRRGLYILHPIVANSSVGACTRRVTIPSHHGHTTGAVGTTGKQYEEHSGCATDTGHGRR
jgi:hypothetical protein